MSRLQPTLLPRALSFPSLAVASCALVVLTGCPRGETVGGSPSASASAGAPQRFGTVRGVVFVRGDSPQPMERTLAKIPAEGCDEARRVYSLAFREGPGRTLGDALVAVTGYAGKAQPKGREPTAEYKGCAYDARVYVLEKGQSLQVKNLWSKPMTPYLTDEASAITMIANPGGDAVTLVPKGLGRLGLRNYTHPFVHADVYVLAYPTTAVTGIDGRFEIAGVPAGKAKVSALLPIALATADKEVDVPPDGAVEVALTVEYSRPAPAASASDSAEPAPSAPSAASAAPAGSAVKP